jgi:hypothetical protein
MGSSAKKRQELVQDKLVTINGIFQITMLSNRGFAGDHPLKKGPKKFQNAEVRLKATAPNRQR